MWLVAQEVNLIGVEIVSLRAGGLPISRQSILDYITDAARRKNIDVKWYHRKDNPVGILKPQADQVRPTIQIHTSSVVDEGKSVVAANLALTLARRAGERVLLIEADLRRPTVSALFSSTQLRGIGEWNDGKLALEDSLYQIRDLPVWLLAAGHPIDEPLPLLESGRFVKMLEAVSQHFDWIVMDATPMLPMADSTSIARLVDGVLVVVRDGYTRKKVLNKALETIDKNKLLGVVFNQATSSSLNDSYYGSYYSNKSGKDSKEAKKEAKRAAKEAKKAQAASA